ncbi:MAG: c-type cytochrome [Acidiferrobacterales bacterium]
MKYFLAGVLTTLVTLLVGGYALLHSGSIPANADGTPGRLELWMARTSLHATLRQQAPKEPDPIPLTTANLIAGVRIFGEHCAVCHGTSRGNASASPVAKGEYPRPPQLASDGVEDDPPGYSFWKIKHGIRLTGMPSFKSALTDHQIWTVSLFLKHMDSLPPAARLAWQQVKN